MSIIDDAADIIRPHIKNAQQEPAYSDDNDDHDIEAAAALHRAGMLCPTPQIIRTAQELEALDPDTMLLSPDSDLGRVCSYMNGPISPPRDGAWPFPSVVLATGEQVRAARTALEVDQ